MVQATMDGLVIGIIFALVAYGMALQWGVMNIINIAQGELVIMGGYIAYFLYIAGIHPAFGVLLSPIIMFFVGATTLFSHLEPSELQITWNNTIGLETFWPPLANFMFP